MTLGKLLRYILEHPQKLKVCRNFSPVQLAQIITRSLAQEAFVIITSEEGDIQGMVACERSDEYKLLHVNFILCNSEIPNVTRLLLAEFEKRFPGYDLQATRKGNLTRYRNTPRLCKLLKVLTN